MSVSFLILVESTSKPTMDFRSDVVSKVKSQGFKGLMCSRVEEYLSSFPFELRERKRKVLRDQEFQRFLIWSKAIGHPYTEEEHLADEERFLEEMKQELEKGSGNDRGDPEKDSDEEVGGKKRRCQKRASKRSANKGKCERQIAREQCAL